MMREPNKAPFSSQAASLAARILLCGFYLIFAVIKLTHVDQTILSMARVGAPSPEFFAWVAIVIEGPVALLALLGIFFRSLCLLLASYTIATGIIGHAYWALPPKQYMAMFTNFYKNVAIAGGFIGLYAMGAGRFSLPLGRS